MMKIKLVVIAGLLCVGSAARAAPKNPASAALAQEIQQELASSDAAAVKKGVVDFDKLVAADPAQAVEMLRDHWLANLMEGRHFAEIDQLCLKIILAQSQDTPLLEAMQLGRIRANLAAHQSQRALQQAKGLYNVSSLATTDQAMLVVAECLAAAFPDDDAIVDRFKAQQVAGAKPLPAATQAAPAAIAVRPAPSTQAATTQVISTGAAGVGSQDLVLQAIHVDDADYRAAIAGDFSEDYAGLMGRGNLLLLGDHPDRAKSIFERAYAQAADSQLLPASEAIARQIKAQDGAIGRANQWIESIRPNKPAKKR